MVKYAPDYTAMNMIGYAHISSEILEDGDILIFPLVLITPKALRPIV